jgi:hypothetical protein
VRAAAAAHTGGFNFFYLPFLVSPCSPGAQERSLIVIIIAIAPICGDVMFSF